MSLALPTVWLLDSSDQRGRYMGNQDVKLRDSDVARTLYKALRAYGIQHDPRFGAVAIHPDAAEAIVYRTAGPQWPVVDAGGPIVADPAVGYQQLVPNGVTVRFLPAVLTESANRTLQQAIASQTPGLIARGVDLTWWSTEKPDGPLVVRYNPSGSIPTVAMLDVPVGIPHGAIIFQPGTVVPLAEPP